MRRVDTYHERGIKVLRITATFCDACAATFCTCAIYSDKLIYDISLQFTGTTTVSNIALHSTCKYCPNVAAAWIKHRIYVLHPITVYSSPYQSQSTVRYQIIPKPCQLLGSIIDRSRSLELTRCAAATPSCLNRLSCPIRKRRCRGAV